MDAEVDREQVTVTAVAFGANDVAKAHRARKAHITASADCPCGQALEAVSHSHCPRCGCTLRRN